MKRKRGAFHRSPFMRGLAMGHRMNDRQAVSDLRRFGQVLAKAQPRHLGLNAAQRTAVFLGGKGFGIEGFLMGPGIAERERGYFGVDSI